VNVHAEGRGLDADLIDFPRGLELSRDIHGRFLLSGSVASTSSAPTRPRYIGSSGTFRDPPEDARVRPSFGW
jgi:hypothetical protein